MNQERKAIDFEEIVRQMMEDKKEPAEDESAGKNDDAAEKSIEIRLLFPYNTENSEVKFFQS